MNFSDFTNFNTLLAFVLLVFPGFISMRVYSLIRPGERAPLKDTVFEALAYSILNLGLMFWAVLWFLATENGLIQSLIVPMVLVVGPLIWPFLLDKILVLLRDKGWVKYGEKTAWDYFFGKQQPCWVIIHMNDGSKIAGVFGSDSYATLYPSQGHIYLEELWAVDQETGVIMGESAVSKGIILKPDDYRFVEIQAYIEAEEEN